MSQRMTKKEVSDAAVALADWFISQEISVANSAIVMIHLLGVITGDCAKDVDDLKFGLGNIHSSLDHHAARAFIVKHNIKL